MAERQQQYDAAIAALPPWYFAPFSADAVTAALYDFFGRGCLWWEKPTASSPVAPRHDEFPQVPTLVLSGDMDQRVPNEITSEVAELYPRGIFVRVAEAVHGAFIWSSVRGKPCHQLYRVLERRHELRCNSRRGLASGGSFPPPGS